MVAASSAPDEIRPARLAITRRRIFSFIRAQLPPLNFITWHYIYFIGTSLFCSVIFWGASTPPRSVSYTDSLFLTVSAMSLAGLNTINLSTLNTFQQIILFILLILGSAVLVSAAVIYIRKSAFEARFQQIKQDRRKQRFGNPSWRNLSHVSSMTRRGPDGSPPRRSSISPNRSHLQDESAVEFEKDEIEAPSRSSLPGVPDDEHSDLEIGPSGSRSETGHHIVFTPEAFIPRSSSQSQQPRPHHRLISMQGVGASSDGLSPRLVSRAALGDSSERELQERQRSVIGDAPSNVLGRNSQFHHLTRAEREELGGAEYRAVSFLAIIVPAYFCLWLLLGGLGLGAWTANFMSDTTTSNGLNPWWVGAFNAVSAFSNSGMSLLDANVIPFEQADYVLITMALLILAGNTCYPIFLRLIVWSLRHTLPRFRPFSEYEKTLQFLLDHPRRCYTNLFPSPHTWWLLLAVITLNGVDWVAFEVLNIGNDAITSLPAGARVLDGLFQALAVRSGGFYVVPISSLRIGLQSLYVVMMYISVFPVVITMRNSNVYEERSLGLYADDMAQDMEAAPAKNGLLRALRRRISPSGARFASSSYFVSQQLRAQLAHDLWWIVLAVLLITIVETGQFENDPVNYSVFNIMFEVVSAYGTVGLSIGLPNQSYSFSGGWHVLSKLILCAVMIRGRHRGLPVAIDRAVLLPGDYLSAAEDEDADIRLSHAYSRTNMK